MTVPLHAPGSAKVIAGCAIALGAMQALGNGFSVYMGLAMLERFDGGPAMLANPAVPAGAKA
jgi:hypothetical protein